MTEAEAKTRLCPFRLDGAVRGNCLASKCMAWRTHDGSPASDGACQLIAGR